jgi:hypothetical protein
VPEPFEGASCVCFHTLPEMLGLGFFVS